MASIEGTNDGSGYGVQGVGKNVEPGKPGGDGVIGRTTMPRQVGVRGVHEVKLGANAVGVQGEVPDAFGVGVKGVSGKQTILPADEAVDIHGSGAWGSSSRGPGVSGTSSKSYGVFGEGERHGLLGRSEKGQGVWGDAKAKDRSGVVGKSQNGPGITGESQADRAGVVGRSEKAQGVWGDAKAKDRSGVVGKSQNGPGITGESQSQDHAGVVGRGPRLAGRFEGDVEVTRDLLLMGADLAEQFEVVGAVRAEPGAVMVLAGDDAVRLSEEPYDRRVAGVVSGAGNYRPALVLDRQDERQDRRALALSGKVWVLVDADHGPIEVGDLLTTSSTPGHAMRVSDAARALGTVIGKALDRLPHGRGLIRVLAALQ